MDKSGSLSGPYTEGLQGEHCLYSLQGFFGEPFSAINKEPVDDMYSQHRYILYVTGGSGEVGGWVGNVRASIQGRPWRTDRPRGVDWLTVMYLSYEHDKGRAATPVPAHGLLGAEWGQRPYIIDTMHSYTLPM